jgi:hypothetical protein
VSTLKRDDILAVKDIQLEIVSVPEWGGEIYVKGMTGVERDAFEASVVQSRGKGVKMDLSNIRAKLASLTICDENGQRLFTDADVRELGKKSAAALQRVFAMAQKLSGIGDQDMAELAEGLEANPLEGSPSD